MSVRLHEHIYSVPMFTASTEFETGLARGAREDSSVEQEIKHHDEELRSCGLRPFSLM